MDIRDIKEQIIRLRRILLDNQIHPDIFILFGSYACGRQKEQSDIDIAVVSRDFGKDRLEEGTLLNYYASEINSKFEMIPVGLDDYFDPDSISPILFEIKKNGTPLF